MGSLIFVRGWGRLATKECFLLLLLWAWFTITSVVSANTSLFAHHTNETWHRWQFVSKILVMTFATIAIVDRFQKLRILVIVTASSFGLFVVKGLPFMVRTGGSFRMYGPEYSMISDNNDFGLALNMTLPLFFFLAQTESKRWVKWLFGFLFVGTIPTIFFTYSRGALVGLVVVLTLMFLQLKQRLLLVPVVILGAVIAILLAPEAWRDRMDPTRDDAIDNSALSRINAWTYSWHLALDYPITGGGFETFTPELFSRYAPDSRDVHGPHSIYFGVLAEHGFVGLCLYLGLVFSAFASTRRLVKLGRYHESVTIINYAKMFQFSMVGFLTSGLFLGRAYFDYFFTIIACLVILKSVCLDEWAGTADVYADATLESA
jgi:probable O-glycosylation ligase (exosortase A-associated)